MTVHGILKRCSVSCVFVYMYPGRGQTYQQNSQSQFGPHGMSIHGRVPPGFLIDEMLLAAELSGFVARVGVEVVFEHMLACCRWVIS